MASLGDSWAGSSSACRVDGRWQSGGCLFVGRLSVRSRNSVRYEKTLGTLSFDFEDFWDHLVVICVKQVLCVLI